MTKRSTIVTVKAPDLGVFLDRPKDVIDPRGWSDCLNVRFKDGKVETSPGWIKFTSTQLPSAVKCIAQYYLLNGTDFVIAITNTKIYKFNTSTDAWDDITGGTLTGTTDKFVDHETFGDILIFTNNIDRVKKWTSSGNISNLAGLNVATDGASGTVDVQAAKALTSFANFMHLFDTTEDGNRMAQRWRWSRYGVVEGWNNSGTYGQAGFADLNDGPDKLVAGRRLGGDFMALYKERSISVAQYVGPPTVWARRLVVDGVGLMAPGAVVSTGNEHLFCGGDNFYVFNGLAIKPIGSPIWNRFIDELNPSAANLVFASLNLEEREVIFAYPAGSSETPNKAVVYNYTTGAWAFRDMPFLTIGKYRRSDSVNSWDGDAMSWDSDAETWDTTHFSTNAPVYLAGDHNGYVYELENGYSQDGAPHDSWVISPAFDRGQPELIKRVFRILADIESTGPHNLNVAIQGTKNKNTPLTWPNIESALPCDLSTDPWVFVDTYGRWVSLRFRTNGTNNRWALTSYGFDFITQSR